MSHARAGQLFIVGFEDKTAPPELLAKIAERLVGGVILFALSVRFLQSRNEHTARALFYGSITYLPLLWIAMVANKL